MKKILTIVLAAVLFAACSSDEPTTPTEVPTPVEEETPVINPVVTELSFSPEETAAAAEMQGFNMDFFKAVNVACVGANENMVCSPMSASMLLSMLANVTDAELSADIVRTLGCNDLEAVNSLSAKLVKGLSTADDAVSISLANSVWFDNFRTLNPAFAAVAQANYDVETFGVPNLTAKSTVDDVNAWVNDKTKGWIPSIINSIPDETIAILINAMYFKGDWANPFDADETHDFVFNGLNDKTTVKMMHKVGMQHYARTDAYEAIRMEFGSGIFNAYFVLPSADVDVNDFISSAALKSVTEASYADQSIDFMLPRFKFESSDDLDLNRAFKSMGIDRLDDTSAFRLFTEYLSASHSIKQKAALEFKEEGAEGAAVTWDIMDGAVGPNGQPAIPEVHFNRPYVFFITEATTSSCLFAGKVVTL